MSRPLLFADPHGEPERPPAPGGVGRGLLLVILIFAATRLLTWTATYCGAFTLFRIEHQIDPPLEKHIRRWREMATTRPTAEYRAFVDRMTDFAPLCRFDGVHYASIIRGGYRYEVPPPDTQDRHKLEQNIAFFPLFPLLCQPCTRLISVNQAMVLVAHLCALAAGILLYLWVQRRIDEPTALWTVTLTFCWPPAVYYSYGYAEGLTLLLMVAALWLMDRRAFWPAAVVCGLATAARPTALAIAIVLLLAWWFNGDRSRGRRLALLVPLGLVATAGALAYAGYLTWRFGSPLVYVDNFKAGWVPDRSRADWVAFLTLTPVWEQFKYFRNLLLFAPPIGLVNAANTLMWNTPLNLFILFLSLAGLPRVPRGFRPLLLLGPLIFLHAYSAGGGANFGIEPIARYTAVAVPAFIVLAAWCRREWPAAARHVLLIFLVLVQVAWAFRFGMQEWSG